MRKTIRNLIADKPMLGSVALGLEIVADDTIPTICTNGKEIRYNPTWFASLNSMEKTGVVVHELYHVMLGHHIRMSEGKYDKKIANIAMDAIVNKFVEQQKLRLPCGCVPQWSTDDSWETIYKKIYNEPPENDGSSSTGTVVGRKELVDVSTRKREEQKIKQVVQRAAQQGYGSALPDEQNAIKKILGAVMQPVISWQEKLREYAVHTVSSGVNWKRPARISYRSGVFMPHNSRKELGNIVVAIDTSGSVDEDLLTQFVTELSEIYAEFTQSEITLLHCDREVLKVEKFEGQEIVPEGGRGTNFRPPFEWLENNEQSPEVLVYFTDGYCYKFPQEPGFKVLWAVYNNRHFKPPFGEVLPIK